MLQWLIGDVEVEIDVAVGMFFSLVDFVQQLCSFFFNVAGF
jgi:hypothetical protein